MDGEGSELITSIKVNRPSVAISPLFLRQSVKLIVTVLGFRASMSSWSIVCDRE
jgi:hypothetical protein